MRCSKFIFIFMMMFLSASAVFADSYGYFTANVINAAGSQNDKSNIYDKLAIVSYENKKYINDLWAQAKYKNFSLGSGADSKGDFNDDVGGLSFGYGMETGKDLSAGFFGKYDSHSMSQANSSAGVNSYGIGAYCGYLYEDYDFKGILSFSGQQYSISRDAGTQQKAKADFNGYGVNADIEASMWLAMSELVNLRPYAGLNIAYTGYGSSSEKGAGGMNLDTGSGTFAKSAIRAGADLNGKYKKFGWYGGLELEFMMTGQYAEIESRLAGTGEKVTSKGAQTDSVLLGINAGGDYDITMNLKTYANLNYKVTGGLSDFTGSAGLAFIFNSF